MKIKVILALTFIALAIASFAQQPVKIGVAGLTHTHVHWIFSSMNRPDFTIVGIAEPNRELALRYLKQYNLSENLLYSSLEEMLEKAKPEAVTAFNSIAEHLEVVEKCAPRGIHVMVEKPLAASLNHARRMEALAKKHNIHLLTNYETTWYGSHFETWKMVHQENKMGDIRKIVVHDGHRGPKEIGVNKEFLDWLTDPVKNGGGALMDFGCYGANLITWLMKGEKPTSVMAVTQQLKPDIYPKVDDEATIIVTYPKAQGIIQASWNWPYNRKDIEVYGESAFIKADRNSLVFQKGDSTSRKIEYPQLKTPYDDPFSYLAAVVRGSIKVSDTDLSALALNMTAMEILDAAKLSSQSGKSVQLRK
jgi:predicted dehydrogenase